MKKRRKKLFFSFSFLFFFPFTIDVDFCYFFEGCSWRITAEEMQVNRCRFWNARIQKPGEISAKYTSRYSKIG